jgi:2-amino-4-hydroxy-6-hydroxymethyldihydropteridine diphosphokinase
MTRFWPFRIPRPLARTEPRTAYVGLGSNLGERLDTLEAALVSLDDAERVSVAAVSSVYETAPVGLPGDEDQPAYLNAVARLTTTRSPRELLDLLHRIETEHGRDRRHERRWGPRPLDLDLLLYDDLELDEPGLTVPHPRLAERAFVLVPLAEVAPAGTTLPDGTRLTARLAALAPIEDVVHHVRLSGVPGTEDDPLLRRPQGPPAPPPRLSGDGR